MRESIRVAALSMMLVLSVASPLLAGSAAGAPSGFVGVPNEQVTEDLPSDYSGEIFVEDLRGETMASSNASSMDVILTTPERAETYLGSNGSVVGRNGVAIVLRDDQNSAGREVALPAAPIRDAFGTVPEQVFGVSSEGDEWSSQTRIEDGSVIFEVPHFSTNTVTFSGTTEITADAATDGSTFSYELADVDSASDPVVNLTGTTTKQWSNESKSDVGTETVQLNVSGNAAPKGPSANNKPTVTFSATPSIHGFENGVSVNHPEWAGWSGDGIDGRTTNPALSGSYSGYIDGKSGQFRDAVITRSNTQKDFIAQFRTSTIPTGSGANWAGRYRFFDDSGTEIGRLVFDTDGSITWEDSDGVETIGSYQAGTTYNIRMSWDFGSDQVTIYKDGSALSTQGYLNSVSGLGEFQFAVYGDTRTYIDGMSHTLADNPAIDINGDGTDEASVSGSLYPGESATKEVGLSSNTSSVNVSTAAGVVDLQFDLRERTVTNNPTVQLNSESVSYSGTLADGESTSLSFKSSALKEGTNNVSVSVGDGSLSADAPSPSVGLDYSHSSSADVSTNFSSTKWQESYNISKTFGSDRTDAELTIPFDGNVVEITNLETRTNGGSWSSADYTMMDTTVTVSLGSVSGGDTIEVRTTGLRVLTHNGAIEVIEPTVLGDDLNSKIEITERSEGFAIETTGTTDLVHYAANPSWTAQDYYVIKGGYRALRLPESNVGSTTRVRTAPIVASTSEETELVVLDPTEPRFRIRPGSTSGADTVEIEYRDATASEPHALRSVTRETDVMVSDADSSGVVSFSTSGSDQTYIIEQRDRSSAPVVQVDDSGSSSGALPIVATFAGIAVSMIGLVFAGRRLGLRGRRSNLLLLLGGGVIGTVGVGLVTGRSIVSDLIFALTELGRSVGSSTAGTIVIAVSILIALYLIDSRLLDLPRWVYLATGIPLALWVIETLTNGALSATFEQVGALAWLLVILGSLALLWRVLQPTIVRIGREG